MQSTMESMQIPPFPPPWKATLFSKLQFNLESEGLQVCQLKMYLGVVSELHSEPFHLS